MKQQLDGVSWQSEREREREGGREREGARKVERASERDIPRRWREEKERGDTEKQRKRKRDEVEENSDPTRPTGSPGSARISCSTTPCAALHLRGSHWWICSLAIPNVSTYLFILILVSSILFVSVFLYRSLEYSVSFFRDTLCVVWILDSRLNSVCMRV